MDFVSMLRVPTELLWIWRDLRNVPVKYLDIGCGNHKATQTRRWLPKSRYFGLDCCNYNNDEADFAQMERFFQVDLATDDLAALPDAFFDVIMMCQVIEHLENGEQVLGRLVEKLAPGGRLYVEFPGRHSQDGWAKVFPFMRFDSDPTHKRVYSWEALSAHLEALGLTVKKAGTRRDWRKFLALPVTVPLNVWRAWVTPEAVGAGLWHVLPRSEYVYAQRL